MACSLTAPDPVATFCSGNNITAGSITVSGTDSAVVPSGPVKLIDGPVTGSEELTSPPSWRFFVQPRLAVEPIKSSCLT